MLNRHFPIILFTATLSLGWLYRSLHVSNPPSPKSRSNDGLMTTEQPKSSTTLGAPKPIKMSPVVREVSRITTLTEAQLTGLEQRALVYRLPSSAKLSQRIDDCQIASFSGKRHEMPQTEWARTSDEGIAFITTPASNFSTVLSSHLKVFQCLSIDGLMLEDRLLHRTTPMSQMPHLPLEGSIETELFIAHKVSSDAQTTLGLRRFVGYELFSNDPQLSAEEFKKLLPYALSSAALSDIVKWKQLPYKLVPGDGVLKVSQKRKTAPRPSSKVTKSLGDQQPSRPKQSSRSNRKRRMPSYRTPDL